MILLEVVDAEQRKKVAKAVSSSNPDETVVFTQRHHDVLEPPPPPSPRLPDYATSQAQAEQQEIIKKSQQGQRKLGRALVYALVIYVVLSVAIAIPLIILWRRSLLSSTYGKSSRQGWVQNGGPPPPNSHGLPPDITVLPSTYGQAIDCNNWTHITSNVSQAVYRLQYLIPANDTIYLRSNFSEPEDNVTTTVTGSMQASISDDTTQTNASVIVDMRDIGQEALKSANVCLMRTDSGWGVVIYVPDGAQEADYYFDIDLRLPQPTNSSTLNGLTTYLPSFNQTLGNLDSYTDLDSVTVQGSLGEINIESVHARSVVVKTSAASITGTFNASEKLILETVLSPITANISLYNGADRIFPPTILDVETGNSDIDINVTLYSPPAKNTTSTYTSTSNNNNNNNNDSDNDSCSRPLFLTSLKTFSGSLVASYTHSPTAQPASLFIRAQNNLEPAQVYVDSKFEGTYDVHTTLADAIVDRDEDGSGTTDPTGANRQRTYVDEFVSTTRAVGWVGWGDQPDGNSKPGRRQGHIEVASSLGAAVLQLTESPDESRYASRISKAVFAQPSQ